MQMKAMEQPKANEVNSRLVTTPIAIVGISSIFPQARSTQEYWDNILRKIDCVTDVPASRWSIEDYYDPNPSTPDKSYCKRGGFIPDIDFDPVEFGLPPNILEVTDVSQLLALLVAKEALEDAGYSALGAETGREFDREHTGVILGVVGISSKLFTPLMARLQYPVWKKALMSSGVTDADAEKIIEKIKLAYVNWEENSFPGTILNVIAGRIANRLDLGATNCVVDAACASSLAAIRMAVGELIEGRANMMITGGVDTDNSIGTYLCFSKTPAFSKGQNVRTFDAESDGMMVGEGLGMLVLKRLADAERDGDRVYAVIKGIGSSSDGRYKSIYAPRPAGQAKALRRAYDEAGFEPSTLGLVEAHGTGTPAGDPAEVQSIREVFSENNPRRNYIALGSVKSQIAHTKAAAGAASLIKTALALHHKVLPPSINVKHPNPKLELENSPFYINTETRPWLRAEGQPPRRAAVSSFGFGGTNFHLVLEEYQSDHQTPYRLQSVPLSLVLHAPTPTQLAETGQQLLTSLQSETGSSRLSEWAQNSIAPEIPAGNARFGFVAADLKEAAELLKLSVDTLKEKTNEESWEHPRGIYYRKTGMDPKGKVAALFAGQGSQYVEMGRELTINFPELRQVYGEMDSLFLADGLRTVSETVYPNPVFDPSELEKQNEAVTRTDYAQPAIGSFSVGQFKLLQKAGFKADFTAGHSFGELTALWAAGVLSDQAYYALAKARGKAMAPPDDANFDAGTMLAVKGDIAKLQEAMKAFPDVVLANFNSNQQVVLAGSKPSIAAAQKALADQGFSVIPLSVSAAFHTPLVGHAQKPFAQAIKAQTFNKPSIPVYSNSTGKRHAQDPEVIRKVLSDHILKPVLFRDEIEAIYQDGGRIFVEFGPKNIQANLVKNILADRPHLALSINPNAKKDSDRQLREAVVQLQVAGLDLKNLDPYILPPKNTTSKKKSAATVVLNGGLYITEKTRSAFEKSLQNGHRIQQAAPAPAPANPTAQNSPTGSNGNGIKPAVPSPANPVGSQTNQPASAPTPVPPSNPAAFERSLGQFYGHQSETVKIHEQYLKNQEEYARTFADLMKMGYGMFNNGLAANQAEQAVHVMDSIERSLNRFHDHQADTLRVHEQYLASQAEFSRTFLGILQNSPVPVQTAENRVLQVETSPVPQTVAPPTPAPEQVSSRIPEAPPAGQPLPAVAAQPAPAAEPNPGSTTITAEILSKALLAIVSEKTGYPTEMLDFGMDMEADLGIDSIKRVEILGAMQNQFPELPKIDTSALSETRTLGHVVELMESGIPTASSSPTSASTGETTPAAAPAAPLAQPSGLDPATLTQALLAVVSEKTGYPTEMLDLGMDMEADLGIDSIKRVEILGAMQNQFPELPKIDTSALSETRTLGQIVDLMGVSLPSSPAAVESSASGETAIPQSTVPASSPAAGLDVETIKNALLAVVAEKTGYPTEMLELSMDMEADLGIDSIKRVEILGTMQNQFPELPKVESSLLAEMRTLQQIIDQLGSVQPASPSLEAEGPLPAETTVVSQPLAEPEEISGLPTGVVRVKSLPQPDNLDYTFPKEHVCLVTHDGTPLTETLVQALTNRGWKVVVVNFPENLVSDPVKISKGIPQVKLEGLGESALDALLAKVKRTHGPVGALIHLNPVHTNGQAELFSESSEKLVEEVFLFAKFLKESLNQAASSGRSTFMTVVRLDGQFGLSQSETLDPVASGLFGLVKSLGQEWDAVYCRAVDITPELESASTVEAILAELDDPNRLVTQVGYGVQGRVTLQVETPEQTRG